MAGGAPEQTVEDDGTVTTHYDTVYNLHMSRKAKNQLLLSQPMGEYGALSLSWDQQTYWNTSKPRKVCSSAWNATFRNLSLGISAQRSSGRTTTRKTISSRCSCRCRWVTRALSTASPFYRYPCGSRWHHCQHRCQWLSAGQENLFYSVNQRYSAQQHYGGDAALQYEGAWGRL